MNIYSTGAHSMGAHPHSMGAQRLVKKKHIRKSDTRKLFTGIS